MFQFETPHVGHVPTQLDHLRVGSVEEHGSGLLPQAGQEGIHCRLEIPGEDDEDTPSRALGRADLANHSTQLLAVVIDNWSLHGVPLRKRFTPSEGSQPRA